MRFSTMNVANIIFSFTMMMVCLAEDSNTAVLAYFSLMFIGSALILFIRITDQFYVLLSTDVEEEAEYDQPVEA